MDASFFLDFDRASSAFRLLFALALDDACLDEEDFYSFESVLSEVLGGARFPEPISSRLRSIYEEVTDSSESIDDLLTVVERDFRNDRESLVAILSIILRMSSNDGMYCKRDKARLRRVTEIFDLSSSELEAIPESERMLLWHCYDSEDAQLVDEDVFRGLEEHYKVLGCSPKCSDERIRRSYRQLVKRYHPDMSSSKTNTHSGYFQRVQIAYEQISAARKRVPVP